MAPVDKTIYRDWLCCHPQTSQSMDPKNSENDKAQELFPGALPIVGSGHPTSECRRETESPWSPELPEHCYRRFRNEMSSTVTPVHWWRVKDDWMYPYK